MRRLYQNVLMYNIKRKEKRNREEEHRSSVATICIHTETRHILHTSCGSDRYNGLYVSTAQ